MIRPLIDSDVVLEDGITRAEIIPNQGARVRSLKDLRTGHEVGNTQGVLDGNLDGFVQAYLLAKAAGKAV